MEGRHDALCAAAQMILKVNELPDRMKGNLVATVGEIQNEVIPHSEKAEKCILALCCEFT